MFFSTVDGTDFPSTVPSSQDITPWGTTSDQGCGIFPITTDPSNAGHVYVSGNQNLWQTQNGGSTWRKLAASREPATSTWRRPNGNNVVIAVGSQVFVTTNALATSGVTFTNITRNLPGRNVPRALFDPVDPTVIYAVLGGFNGSGTGNPDTSSAPRSAAPPGPTSPRPSVRWPSRWTSRSTRSLSTARRSRRPSTSGPISACSAPWTLGASWSILDDIHFPRVPVTDLVLNQTAGVLCAGTYGRGVFKFTKPAGPSIAVKLQDEPQLRDRLRPNRYLTLTSTTSEPRI